jgi:hypothetical protein
MKIYRLFHPIIQARLILLKLEEKLLLGDQLTRAKKKTI